MDAGDWISIVALFVAVVAFIPGFVALHRQSTRIKIPSITPDVREWAGKLSIYYDVTLCNASNEPITIYSIELKSKHTTHSILNFKQIEIAAHGTTKTTFQFSIPKDIPTDNLKLILKTSVKNIVIRKLPKLIITP